MVKILFGLESRSKLKSFAEIDALTHADAMPKLRFYLSGDHIGIKAFRRRLAAKDQRHKGAGQ